MRESNTRKYFAYFADLLTITPFSDTSGMSEMCSIVFWCVLSKKNGGNAHHPILDVLLVNYNILYFTIKNFTKHINSVC